MDNYSKELEKNLMEMVKAKEQSDKRLLTMELLFGISFTIVFVAIILVAALVPIKIWLRVALIVFAFIMFFAGCFMALRIEQVAGYYECKECGHKYVPTYKAVNMAPHMGRTRYMKCPECNKKSWQKKVLS